MFGNHFNVAERIAVIFSSKRLIKNKVKGGHAALRGVVRCFVASFFSPMGSIILVNQLGTLSKFPGIGMLLPYFKVDWGAIRWVTL